MKFINSNGKGYCPTHGSYYGVACKECFRNDPINGATESRIREAFEEYFKQPNVGDKLLSTVTEELVDLPICKDYISSSQDELERGFRTYLVERIAGKVFLDYLADELSKKPYQ